MSQPKNWEAARAVVLHRDRYVCQMCHEADATDVDHIWPRAAGGQDDLDNLQAACSPCNRAKSDSYDLANATMQQLLWFHNHNNEKLQAANQAVWESRFLIETHGAGLTGWPPRTVSQVPEDERLDYDSAEAKAFSMLTRRNWEGNSYAGVTADQMAQHAADVRTFAETEHSMLIAEVEAAEGLAAAMSEAGDPNLHAYLVRTGSARPAKRPGLMPIFDLFVGGGDDK